MNKNNTDERFHQGAADAGRFFNYMAEFIGFNQLDIQAIKESRFIIEKYLPSMIGDFYAQLLRFPETRKVFLKDDGTVDQEFLQMRMQHQANFWRRTASGQFDEEYARFIDYVGRAHTSHGADPSIYIPERYVMGMIGFVQQRITIALSTELRELDPDLELRATKAWNTLLILLLELFSRPYNPQEETAFEPPTNIDDQSMRNLSIDSYERALGIARSIETRTIVVGRVEEIPDGERKIIKVDELSIGVFHHNGQWYALLNSCLHRGGPICTGSLDGETLTCPWHGYQYNLINGRLLLDPDARLPMFDIEIKNGFIHLYIPHFIRDSLEINLDFPKDQARPDDVLKENEFRLSELSPGNVKKVFVAGKPVAVYNVDGNYFATQEECTHAEGPLSEGWLEGSKIICPWHDSCFDVTNGSVLCGPADESLKTYCVHISGEKGWVVDKPA